MLGFLNQGELSLSRRRREQLLFLMDNGIYVVTILLFIAFIFLAPYFFTTRNLVNVLISASLAGIVTAGYTVAILAGQIDTSTQGVLAVATVTTALLFEEVGLSLPLTVILALGAGIAAGLFNGVIVVNGRIVAFVATLATSGVLLAISLFLSGGQTITIAREGLQEVVFIRLFGIPSSVWIMFMCYIVGWVMLTQTKLGAHIYATGADYRAALLSGVPVNRVIRVALVISALTAALTAILVTARAKQSAMFGLAIAGSVDFVTALTAVLLGGFSLFGGVGRIERNLVAVLFLTILGNGLQLMDVATGVILIVRGFALVLAVILSVLRARMT